jgi:hypothetical protein
VRNYSIPSTAATSTKRRVASVYQFYISADVSHSDHGGVTNTDPLECNVCGKKCSTLEKLQKHKIKRHSESSSDESAGELAEQVSKKVRVAKKATVEQDADRDKRLMQAPVDDFDLYAAIISANTCSSQTTGETSSKGKAKERTPPLPPSSQSVDSLFGSSPGPSRSAWKNEPAPITKPQPGAVAPRKLSTGNVRGTKPMDMQYTGNIPVKATILAKALAVAAKPPTAAMKRAGFPNFKKKTGETGGPRAGSSASPVVTQGGLQSAGATPTMPSFAPQAVLQQQRQPPLEMDTATDFDINRTNT